MMHQPSLRRPLGRIADRDFDGQVARTGRIIGTVGFEWDAEMDFALVEVEKVIGPILSDPDVDEVLVRHFDPRQSPVMTLGLVSGEGGPDLAELRLLARRQVATFSWWPERRTSGTSSPCHDAGRV